MIVKNNESSTEMKKKKEKKRQKREDKERKVEEGNIEQVVENLSSLNDTHSNQSLILSSIYTY